MLRLLDHTKLLAFSVKGLPRFGFGALLFMHFLSIFPALSIAQTGSSPVIVSVAVVRPTLIDYLLTPNHPELHGKYYVGLDATIARQQKNQRNPLFRANRYPQLGVGLHVAALHTVSFGPVAAGFAFFNAPLGKEREGRPVAMRYQVSLGMAYLDKAVEIRNYSGKQMLGSQLNLYFDTQIQSWFRLSAVYRGAVVAGFRHFSNGAYRVPNFGVNMVHAGLVVQYHPIPILGSPAPVRVDTLFVRHTEWVVCVGGGGREFYSETKMLKADASLAWLYAFRPNYKAGCGLEAFVTRMPNIYSSLQPDFFGSVSYAATANWEWQITHWLSMPVTLGIYFNRKADFQEKKPYYEKVGTRFGLGNHLFLGWNIKAHANIADYIELYAGYKLSRVKARKG